MNNVPFDPDETHGGEHDEELLDANSMTWGSVDPDFDEQFRERLGPLPLMPTPPYAFERVLVAGRRRRARKVWTGAAAAAFVVMAGTAGTTVALHGGSAPGGSSLGEAHSGAPSTSAAASKSPSASPTPSPSKSATPTSSASSTASAAAGGVPTTSPSASTPQCHSDDFKLSVNVSGTSDVLTVVLTNQSGHTCTTYGFPGLETETQSQQDQSTTVNRVKTSPVQTLTVPSGASISSTSTFATETGTATAGANCEAPSYYLAVIPPNEQTQIVATITGGPVTVCGGGDLETDPFVMGSGGG
jgi:Protein of unknown function (DUF4232)